MQAETASCRLHHGCKDISQLALRQVLILDSIMHKALHLVVSEIVIVAHFSLQGTLWIKLHAAMIKSGVASCPDAIFVASNGLKLIALLPGPAKHTIIQELGMCY